MYKLGNVQKFKEKTKPVIHPIKRHEQDIPQAIKRREDTIISILLTGDIHIFQVIKQNIKIEDFNDQINQKIVRKLYEEFEKGNSNINSIIDMLEEEEQSHITEIMANDDEIADVEKAIDDIMHSYEKDKLNERKFEILALLEGNLETNQKQDLEKELMEIVVRLARIK